MIDVTPQGPGFFFFFRYKTIESGGYKKPVYVDYGTEGERFTPKTKDEEDAKPIIEAVLEKAVETQEIETKTDIDLMLRLRLEREGLNYNIAYLEWVLGQIRRRKRNKAAVLLLLN